MNENNTIYKFLEDESFKELILFDDKSKIAFWKEYLKENPEEKEQFDKAVVMLRFLADKNELVSQREINKQWQRFENDIQPARSVPFWSIYKRPLRMSAASIIFLFLTAIIFMYFKTHTITTAIAETKHIHLLDGSQITLNANSQIEMPNFPFLHQHRGVKLKGNAFFEIVKAKKSFIVDTKMMDIKVLGTKFEVNTYAANHTIFLKEGSVSVFNKIKNNHLQLQPNEKAELNDKGVMSIARVSDTFTIDWLLKRLIFENSPLSKVAERINNLYGIKLLLDKSIENETITASFPYTPSPTPILQSIIKSNGLNWKYIDATTLELYR